MKVLLDPVQSFALFLGRVLHIISVASQSSDRVDHSAIAHPLPMAARRF